MAKQQQPDTGNVMNSPQATKFLKNKAALADLVKSPDTQKLVNMLNQSAGGGLKAAAEAAMKGDTAQLMGLMNNLMKDPDGAKVVDRINQSIPK